MKRWKVILATALIFATGVATGAFVGRVAARATRSPRAAGMPFSPVDNRFDPVWRMREELKLTPPQSARIEAILAEGRERSRKIWDTVQPQLREEMKQVRERIQAELNDEQRAKFAELTKRSREKRGSRPEGTGHGNRPHPERPEGAPPPPNGHTP